MSRPWRASSLASSWKVLPVGAGGFLTGISIGNDNTMAVRTDTYGAYVWNASATSPVGTTGTWQQVCTSTSLGGTGFQFLTNSLGSNRGVWDIQVSYNSPNILYMAWSDIVDANMGGGLNIAIYKSLDRGKSWVRTNFTPVSWPANLGPGPKNWSKKVAIDPTNSNIVYFGTHSNGLFFTTDGGNTWTNIPAGTVPFATGAGDYSLEVGVFNSIQYVMAAIDGVGIYLNTGGTWNNITTGGPTASIRHVVFDNNTGNFFLSDNNDSVNARGNVWKYTASSGSPGWTQIYSGNLANDVAVDPKHGNHVVISDGSAHLNESTDGTTFNGFTTGTGMLTTTGDIPWLSQAFANSGINIAFDAITDRVIWGVNNGCASTASWTGTLGPSNNITNGSWACQSRGIEQLVGNVVIVPSPGKPILGFWDTGLVSNWSLKSYPSASNCVTFNYNGIISCSGCWTVDFAKDNSGLVVALIDGQGGINDITPPSNYPSYSLDGGVTWQAYTSPVTDKGGSVAVSTSTDVMFAPPGVPPYFTTNFGTSPTWTPISISGVSSWSFMPPTGSYVTADGLNPHTFYVLVQGTGFYVTTNSGANWSALSGGTYPIPGDPSGSTTAVRVKATTGVASDFWFTSQGGSGGNLYHYYPSGGLTLITNVSNAFAVGFGYSGGAYPSVYMIGQVNGVHGTWRSDNAATGATPTWSLVGGVNYPNPPQALGIIALPHDMSGDPGIIGRCYIAFNSHWAYFG